MAAFIGPYRNLTTLSAAVLSLHPEIQVLNHAGERLLSRPELDFAATPTPQTLGRFIAAGLEASGGGRRGQFGGSILYSHAFDSPALREAYRRRYGDTRVKPEARLFAWKESFRLQQRLMGQAGRLDRMMAGLPNLSLLAPFRHPLDVAFSSRKTHHRQMLTGKPEPTVLEILSSVFDAFRWVLTQRDRRPDRILFYTQWDFGEPLLRRLAAFLGVAEDAQWLADGARCLVLKSGYEHPPELLAACREMARTRLAEWPEVTERLLAAG
jgi:hypothetical protein